MDVEKLIREKIALQGKSKNTADTYWLYVNKYLEFCRSRNIGRETKAEVAVERWLTRLAVDEGYAKNSQNLALQSVCYLYKQVLNRPLVGVNAMRAKRPQMVRDVISVEDVAALFSELRGANLLAAKIMYATGLRVGLVSELRRKDFLFDRNQILVHSAKGDKGRYVSFPPILHDSVLKQFESVKTLWRWDRDGNNPNGVSLPGAYRRKSKSASSDFAWYYLFPSDTLSIGSEGVLCRHHRDPGGFTREIKKASQRAEIENRVTSHILRHSYATHAHEMGVSMRTLQVLMGHNDIRTTEIYVHASANGATASPSPLALALANPRTRNANSPGLRVVG